MAVQAPAIPDRYFESTVAADSRRLLALPGVVAVVGALVTAAISFAILVGVTPITPVAGVLIGEIDMTSTSEMPLERLFP